MHNFSEICFVKYGVPILEHWILNGKKAFLLENACGTSHSEYKWAVLSFLDWDAASPTLNPTNPFKLGETHWHSLKSKTEKW